MKNVIRVLVFILFISSYNFAQSYSVSITTINNGSTIANFYNDHQVAITVGISASGTPHQYHQKWKFVLNTENGTHTIYDNNSFPTVYRGCGNYSWSVNMVEVLKDGSEYNRASCSVNFTVKYLITASNNFGAGSIILDNSSVVSGSNVKKNIDENVSVAAVDQTHNGYNMLWNTNGSNLSNWLKNGFPILGATSRNYSYTIQSNDNGLTLTADMKKLCNLTFSNPGRAIYLNGNTYNSSVTANVVEQNTVSPGAEGYFVVDGIEHFFLGEWKNIAGQSFSTITASLHETYTAAYRIQAVNPGISFGSNLNQPIVINWTDNSNTNVTQYRIHRREYYNGWGPDQVIATVNRGVQTYTDNDYILKPWRQNTWLEYGITAYYTVNNSWSTGGANTQVYGLQTLMQSNDSALLNTETEVPADYSIGNYPNPFNPATTINYQLPKDGVVSIKVYDVLGKEVAALVNEQKSAGYYKVEFNGNGLTSGLYICSIQAGSFSKSIKLMLTK